MIKDRVENTFYNSIIKRLLSVSKLGRTTMRGEADSGLNIDHMYRNAPKGITRIGKLVDKVLLNLPSVQATRHKKDVIIKILCNDIENNNILNKKTKILDIASGPARYLVDVINSFNKDMIEVLCLDSDRRSINFGRVLAGKKPIRYTKANVFKLQHLKFLAKRVAWLPNIIITTGFFEMLEDNIFEKMLQDAFKYIEKGGLILFTAQANNPSKKLMHKVGKKHNGKSWNLYFRTPNYLRKKMIDIGFRDVIVSVDNWGMYEYCTGRKI
jgi:uncharacterized pyridoxamine 5'-phosphate oxidase family protein